MKPKYGSSRKAFEEAAIAEDRFQLVPADGSFAMDGAEQGRELVDVIGNHLAAQEHLLPVLMRLRHRCHGDEVVLEILEDERRGGSRRRDPFQPAQSQRFAVHPLDRGEPIDLDAQLGERLLEHPGIAIDPLDQHRLIGNTAL